MLLQCPVARKIPLYISIPLTANICCQTTTNHSNLGIFGAMAHAIFIKCIQLTALGHVKSAGRGVYAHTAKKTFYKRLWSVSLCVLSEGGCNVMPVWLACHCLVACIGCWSDSRCVSHNRPWMPVDFQSIQHRHCMISASPSFAEASESRGKHNWTHRVGSQRRLVLETACSDPQMHNVIAMPMHFLVQILRPLWWRGSW